MLHKKFNYSNNERIATTKKKDVKLSAFLTRKRFATSKKSVNPAFIWVARSKRKGEPDSQACSTCGHLLEHHQS